MTSLEALDPIKTCPSTTTALRERRSGKWIFIVLIFFVGLLIRLPLLGQSLWYDEIHTIVSQVMEPWRSIVAGTYTPNNHILYSLLAKVTNEVTGGIDPLRASRVPAMLAGALAGVIIALPLLARRPSAAVMLAVITTLHPWLLSISGQARGYPLLLLFALLSTQLLASGRQPTVYVICVILMLYTHPIGLAIIAGHGVAVMSGHAWNRRAWLRAIGVAGLVTLLLYLPAFRSVGTYWAQKPRPTVGYAEFFAQSFAYSVAGWPAAPLLLYAGVAAGVMLIGLPLIVRKVPEQRILIEVFTVATVFGLLFPLLLPSAGEPRGVLWLIPLVCLGLQGLLLAAPDGFGGTVGFLMISAILVADYSIFRIPPQPIQQAVDQSHALADLDQPVVGVYLGASETRAVYGLDAVAYRLTSADGVAGLVEVENQSAHPPILLILFDSLLHRDEPDLWKHIYSRYTLASRLPGRVSDILIFKPLQNAATTQFSNPQ